MHLQDALAIFVFLSFSKLMDDLFTLINFNLHI